MKIQTEDKSYVRDTYSMALINSDRKALQLHKQNRKHFEEIQDLKSEVEELKSSLNEVLDILKAFRSKD